MWALAKQKALAIISNHGNSYQTEIIVGRMLDDFFDETNAVDVLQIGKNLSKCAVKENVLYVRDDDGYNLLQKAIIFDNLQVVKLLGQHGCLSDKVIQSDIESRMIQDSPLHLACALGRYEICEELLNCGLDARSIGFLSLNLPRGPANKIPRIIREGVRPMQHYHSEREPAYYAVCYNNHRVLELLRDHGGAQNHKTVERDLLHVACYLGHYECAEILLELFPEDINTTCPAQYGDGSIYRYTPLTVAVRHGPRFVRMLLEKGVNPSFLSLQNVMHVFYWYLATSPYPRCSEAVEMTELLLNKVHLAAQQLDACSQTPLHVLLEAINYTPVIDTDPSDFNFGAEETVLLKSYDDIIRKCIHTLVKAGIDLNQKDHTGDTVLCKIMRNDKHLQRYELYEEHREGLSMQDSIEDLVYKSRGFGISNIVAVVHCFLENGADPNEKDSEGLNALGIALEILGGDSLVCSTKPRFNFVANHEGRMGYLDLFKTLVEYNTSLDMQPSPVLRVLDIVEDYLICCWKNERSPDHEVVRASIDLIQLFLKHGAKLFYESEKLKVTVLDSLYELSLKLSYWLRELSGSP